MKEDKFNLNILGFARTSCDRLWQWHNDHGKPSDYVLWLIESGNGTIQINDTDQSVGSGECLIIPLWHKIYGSHKDDTPFIVQWVTFSICDAAGQPLDLRNPQNKKLQFPLRRYLPETSFFQRLMTRLLASDSQQEREDYLRVMLHELNYQDKFVHSQGLDSEIYRGITAICADIRNAPGYHWQVGEMAAHMHYSPDHFSRIFRQATGHRPLEYVIMHRIEAAKGLLSYSGSSISDIAQTLGYCDVYHFCRQFKRKTGLTPMQQRRGKR